MGPTTTSELAWGLWLPHLGKVTMRQRCKEAPARLHAGAMVGVNRHKMLGDELKFEDELVRVCYCYFITDMSGHRRR
jgi:hypothetical protein